MSSSNTGSNSGTNEMNYSCIMKENFFNIIFNVTGGLIEIFSRGWRSFIWKFPQSPLHKTQALMWRLAPSDCHCSFTAPLKVTSHNCKVTVSARMYCLCFLMCQYLYRSVHYYTLSWQVIKHKKWIHSAHAKRHLLNAEKNVSSSRRASLLIVTHAASRKAEPVLRKPAG